MPWASDLARPVLSWTNKDEIWYAHTPHSVFWFKTLVAKMSYAPHLYNANQHMSELHKAAPLSLQASPSVFTRFLLPNNSSSSIRTVLYFNLLKDMFFFTSVAGWAVTCIVFTLYFYYSICVHTLLLLQAERSAYNLAHSRPTISLSGVWLHLYSGIQICFLSDLPYHLLVGKYGKYKRISLLYLLRLN